MLETHDYFLVALAFLISTIVMALVVILWLPQQVLVGYVTFPGGGLIHLDRGWPLSILILLPFSLFLGFLLAGLVRQYLFSPR